MNPTLSETIYADFITSSPTTGAAIDADSTPTCEVFEDATDTATLSPTVVKRTGKTGNYRIPIACTGANGFEAGKSYNVVVSATVGAVAAKAVVQTFQIRAADTDINNTAILQRATPAQVDTSLTNYGALKPTTAGRTLDIATTGEAGLDFSNTTGTIPDSAGVTTLLGRVSSTIFTGITSLKEWLGLLAGKQTGNATARTEIRSTGAGSGTYDEVTDSAEAIRDRGDAAWITGAGGDPWATSLPGAYSAGTAGNIIGNRMDAAVTTRATPTQVNTECDTALADVGLTTTVTGRIDAAISTRSTYAGADTSGTTTLLSRVPTTASSQTSVDTLATYVDTEVAAIKAKTDQLTFTTPGKVDASATMALSGTDLNSIADTLLKRDWNSVTGEAAYSALNAFRMLRNVWSSAGGTLTVKKEDGSTTAWTRTLSTDPAAEPITGAS